MTEREAVEPVLVAVDGGPFLMGSDREKDPDSRYRQEPEPLILDLPKFSIGKYQVTVAEYRPFVDSGGYRLGEDVWGHYGWVWREKKALHEKRPIVQPDCWTDPVFTGDERLPVVGVCWYEAMAYCRWLSRKTGRSYGLPTEAEWEKAARGTDGRIYPWGDAFEEGRCNCGRRDHLRALLAHLELRMYDFTMSVGSYPGGMSPWGGMDMSGNVEEWCLSKDVDLHDHPELADPRKHPRNQDKDDPRTRILRGGSYHHQPSEVRAAARRFLPPGTAGNDTGFRIVRDGLTSRWTS